MGWNKGTGNKQGKEFRVIQPTSPEKRRYSPKNRQILDAMFIADILHKSIPFNKKALFTFINPMQKTKNPKGKTP